MRRCDVGGSGESMSVRIYLQQRRLAALLCFFVFFFFSSMGSRQVRSSLTATCRGQMVAVLVLGPKPQPLFVLLLWLFGSVLPRATCKERKH